MNDCAFCNGKLISAEYVGQGIITMSMMVGMLFGGGSDDEERDYAYNGIIIKDGNRLCFDNSAGEYAELSLEIKHCPFCGKELHHVDADA